MHQHKDFTARVSALEEELTVQYEVDGKRTGYLSLHPNHSMTNLQALQRKGVINDGDRFIDLGSGLGVHTAVAARLGLEAYGIELDEGLVKLSRELIQDLKGEGWIPKEQTALTAVGTYFPEEYLKLRQEADDIASKYEGKIFDKKYLLEGNGHQDGFKELGLRPDEFDVFFAYLWEAQIPSVFEIFSRYARDDAKLVAFSPEMPGNKDYLLRELSLKSENINAFPAYSFELVRKG